MRVYFNIKIFKSENDIYAIYHKKDQNLAWSNEFGWVDTQTFDIFTEEEKQTISLPIEGEWRKVS